MLFVEEDRLQVQTVEKHQALQAVGALDILGGSTEAVGNPLDKVTSRRRLGRIFRQSADLRICLGLELDPRSRRT